MQGTLIALMKPPMLRTDRLILRRWMDRDREAFARINSDPEVMRYRLRTLSPQESNDLLDEIESSFDRNGFGIWAVEPKGTPGLIGYIGLEVASEEMPFRPLVHIGWHLALPAWHHGYATEGAAAVLDFAFGLAGLPEVVAHTTARNERSRAVMHRLGMTHNPVDDFDAPWYPRGHPNRRFVLYRVTKDAWCGGSDQRHRSVIRPSGWTKARDPI